MILAWPYSRQLSMIPTKNYNLVEHTISLYYSKIARNYCEITLLFRTDVLSKDRIFIISLCFSYISHIVPTFASNYANSSTFSTFNIISFFLYELNGYNLLEFNILLRLSLFYDLPLTTLCLRPIVWIFGIIVDRKLPYRSYSYSSLFLRSV